MDGMEVSQYQPRKKKIVGSGSTGGLPHFLFSFTPRAYAGAKEYRRWNVLRDFFLSPLSRTLFHKSVLRWGHERN